MGWAMGDFGIVQASGGTRRLSDVGGAGVAIQSKAAKALASLQNIMLALVCSVAGVLFIQWSCRMLWTYRVNRLYYKQRRYSKKAKFIGFPSLFVFPGIMMVAISVFLTGLMSKSVVLLMSDNHDDCDTMCNVMSGSNDVEEKTLR